MSEGTRPDSTTDHLVGTKVNQFVVRRQLAVGGMGAVYLLEHENEKLSLKRVLKVLLPEYARNPAIRGRFEREAEAAAKLKHENILAIENYGTLPDGQLFMLVPFLEGEPLDRYLASKGGRLPLHRALHIILQLCDALDHAHAAGVVHRDIKPGNVFVSPTARDPNFIKLLDFGIAKILGSHDGPSNTRTGMAIGTPSYMACEQYSRANEATHLADVFSLAVMAFEMVTGRLPWGYQDPAVLYFMQRSEIPACPSEMPPEWFETIRAALSFDPAQRPASVRALAIALATATPAIPPFVPSGLEMLERIQPRFLDLGATDETLRSPNGRPSLPRYPVGQTGGPAVQPATPPTADERSLATSNERPVGQVVASRPTTLSSSSGVAEASVARPASWWKMVLAAVVVGGVIGAVAFRMSAGRESVEQPTGESAPATSPQTAHAPSASVPVPPTGIKAAAPTASGPTTEQLKPAASTAPAEVVHQAAAVSPPQTPPNPSTSATQPSAHEVPKRTRPSTPRRTAGEPTTPRGDTPRTLPGEPTTKAPEPHAGSSQERRHPFDPNAPAGDD